jgi:drug/metabolite transporter (DMT)-like permease
VSAAADLLGSRQGEAMAVAVAFMWAWGATLFTAAGRRAGAAAVNFARLPLAVVLLGSFHLLLDGRIWPAGLDGTAHAWLIVSGVVGLTLGDSLLFYAFTVVGPRRALAMFATAPLFTAATAWGLLGERLGPRALAGMALIIGGVMLAGLGRDEGGGPFRAVAPALRRRGLLAALAGGVCQGLGATSAKLGMVTLSPLSATFVRMTWGAVAMTLLVLWRGQVRASTGHFRDRRALTPLLGAVVLGPFLGVWGSLYAFKHADAGVAMALIGTTPITIMLPSWLVYRDHPSRHGLLGAVAAVVGGALLFLR